MFNFVSNINVSNHPNLVRILYGFDGPIFLLKMLFYCTGMYFVYIGKRFTWKRKGVYTIIIFHGYGCTVGVKKSLPHTSCNSRSSVSELVPSYWRIGNSARDPMATYSATAHYVCHKILGIPYIWGPASPYYR